MDRLQSGLNPNLAATVADKLWQFQLRKENKAILDQLQENERRRQADAAEAERKLKESANRIKALESRLSEVEREKIKEDQARKEFMKVDAAFKANFKTFLEGRLYEGWWRMHVLVRQEADNSQTVFGTS
jgi:DNA repair exonuclease SbcCD ATPase subunit